MDPNHQLNRCFFGGIVIYLLKTQQANATCRVHGLYSQTFFVDKTPHHFYHSAFFIIRLTAQCLYRTRKTSKNSSRTGLRCLTHRLVIWHDIVKAITYHKSNWCLVQKHQDQLIVDRKLEFRREMQLRTHQQQNRNQRTRSNEMLVSVVVVFSSVKTQWKLLKIFFSESSESPQKISLRDSCCFC